MQFTEEELKLIEDTVNKGQRLNASGRSVFYKYLDFGSGRIKAREIYFTIDKQKLIEIVKENNRLLDEY